MAGGLPFGGQAFPRPSPTCRRTRVRRLTIAAEVSIGNDYHDAAMAPTTPEACQLAQANAEALIRDHGASNRTKAS